MHTDPEYVEHQEGPDGQWCDLLIRIPYENQRVIEIGMSHARSNNDRLDAIFQGMLKGCEVKDYLTGEPSDDPMKAATEVIQPWRERAMELYNAWSAVAFPGPKGSPRKPGNRTPTSGKVSTNAA